MLCKFVWVVTEAYIIMVTIWFGILWMQQSGTDSQRLQNIMYTTYFSASTVPQQPHAVACLWVAIKLFLIMSLIKILFCSLLIMAKKCIMLFPTGQLCPRFVFTRVLYIQASMDLLTSFYYEKLGQILLFNVEIPALF